MPCIECDTGNRYSEDPVIGDRQKEAVYVVQCMLIWKSGFGDIQFCRNGLIIAGDFCDHAGAGSLIFHIKCVQFQCILTGYRDTAGVELQGTGVVMPDEFQETDIAVFLMIFIFIEIEDTRVHSCLQSCLF